MPSQVSDLQITRRAGKKSVLNKKKKSRLYQLDEALKTTENMARKRVSVVTMRAEDIHFTQMITYI